MASNNEGSASSSSSITGPNKKTKKLTSDVWDHFVYLPSVDDPRVGEACCITCGTKLKAGGKKYGTSHLTRHIGSEKCKAAAKEYLKDFLPPEHH